MADSVTPLAAKQAPAGKTADVQETKPLTLAQRMAAVRAEAFGVGKSDVEMQNKERTKKWTIKAHTVDAVLSEIRPLLEKHGVGITPMLVEHRFNGNLCIATYNFEFMDLETGEARVILWAGAGADNSDKALAKAGTNALKEMLKKVFLITDRDDAKEEEDKVEHQTDEGVSRAASDKTNEKLKAAIESKAKLVRAALKDAKSLDDVNRLEREHKKWIKELPDVTRTFFEDLIRDRKAYFAPPSEEEVAAAEEVWEDPEEGDPQ